MYILGIERIIYFHINFNAENFFVIRINRNTSSAWKRFKLVLRDSTPLCKLIETNIQTFIYPHFLAEISVN